MSGYSFPSHYPPNCPPSAYGEAPGVYYRLVCDPDGISSKDFLSDFDKGRRKNWEANSPCCRRCISVHSTLAGVITVWKQFQTLPRHIAELNLNGNHGIIHPVSNNNDTHHAWWIPMGIDPCSFLVRILQE